MKLDFFDFSVQHMIREEQYRQSVKAIRAFADKHTVKRDEECTMAEVRDDLISKGVNQESITYSTTEYLDHLEVRINGATYTLDIPLFPKKRKGRSIRFASIENHFHQELELKSVPEGVADFILAVVAWIPEYLMIEERMLAEEKQRKLACGIALDLLKKRLGQILDDKGYEHNVIWREYEDRAKIRITVSEIFQISLEVNLLEDFLGQVTQIVESLPVNRTVLEGF